MSLNLGIEGQPAVVEVKVITETKELSYPFELAAIPLASFDQMPEALAALEFPGHESPVTLEFVRFGGEEGFRKVEMRVVNHSNKAIRRLLLDVTCTDAQGTVVDETPHMHEGFTGAEEGFGGGQSMLAAGSESQIEIPAFFAEGATQATATPNTVIFSDATVWESQGDDTDPNSR